MTRLAMRSEVVYELRLEEMKACGTASKADAARNRGDTFTKALLRGGDAARDTAKRLQLQSELATLELVRTKRQFKSECVFRQPAPRSVDAEDR
jgi:hypothetical protein